MNGADDFDRFRRILVALDASASSLAALEVAAGLATCLRSELAGLFVEDDDLMNLAELPFAREISLPGGAVRPLDPARMKQEMEQQAAAARRALRVEAQRRRLSWDFRVVRGRVERELSAAAAMADLICVGQGMRPMTRRARLGGTARRAAAGDTAVLFVDRATAGGPGPVMVIDDGSPTARRALRLAIRIARDRGQSLILFILADEAVAAAEIQDKAADEVPDDVPAEFTPLVPAAAETLQVALRAATGGLLVAGGDSLYLVGKVLGHRHTSTTEIYAHVHDDPLLAVADRTARKPGAPTSSTTRVSPTTRRGALICSLSTT